MHVYCKASFVTVVLITQKYVCRCILSARYTFVMYTFARKDYSFGERLYLPRKRTGAKQRKRRICCTSHVVREAGFRSFRTGSLVRKAAFRAWRTGAPVRKAKSRAWRTRSLVREAAFRAWRTSSLVRNMLFRAWRAVRMGRKKGFRSIRAVAPARSAGLHALAEQDAWHGTRAFLPGARPRRRKRGPGGPLGQSEKGPRRDPGARAQKRGRGPEGPLPWRMPRAGQQRPALPRPSAAVP